MTISLQFVNVGTASGGQQGALSTVDQRAIRSQAMKDFRRRQREAKKTSSVLATTQHSAQVPDGCPKQDDKALQWIDLTHRYREGPDTPSSSSRQSQSSSSPSLPCVKCGACHDSASESDRASDCGSDCIRKEQSLSRQELQISIPEAINSPAMFRGHFFQSYIEVYYPSCIWSNPRMIGTLSTWSVARSQAMLHINDSVGLSHFGYLGQDQRLALEARKLHVVAANSLRREIGDPSTAIEIRASAVINMMMTEMYSATASGLAGCATHLAGTTALLHAHLSQPNARPVHAGILSQYTRFILVQDLVHRKATSLDKRLVDYEDEFTPGSIEALIHLGLSLPRLVEASDCRHKERSNLQEHDPSSAALILECVGLGLQLETWLRDYESEGFRYKKSPLVFRSPVDANVLGLYWSLRLLLAECLYLLNSAGLSTTPRQRAAQSAKREANMYAALLLETAQVLQGLDGSAMGKATSVRAPLLFAKQWWIRVGKGKGKEVHAVEAIEHQLRTQLPGIEWITLLYFSFMAASFLERI
jgi:hypothetical protein